jgi:hypothetical protein
MEEATKLIFDLYWLKEKKVIASKKNKKRK